MTDSNASLLVVDNDELNRDMLSRRLTREGYSVITVSNGRQALTNVEKKHFDLVLLDLEMPGLSGYDVLQLLRDKYPSNELPVIMVTATHESQAIVKTLSYGANDYVTKPIDFPVLKARLETQLNWKQAEDEIRKLNNILKEQTIELQAANKELEAFSYSVSHDLRAPLRSINGFSRAVIEDYGSKLDIQGQTYLDRISAASQRMGQLIDGLLNLSRLTRSNIDRKKFNLSELAQEIMDEITLTEPAHKIEIKITPGLFVEANKNLLRIAMNNLLSNAVKYTSKHNHPRIEIGLNDSDNGEQIYFIKDNGVGFDMAYADKLFGVFQRLHHADEFEGLGIGLATVQRIIQRHGGQIWAESTINKGAIFYFTLDNMRDGHAG